MQLSPKEIRQARAFLQMRGIPSGTLPPMVLAATAARMGKGFDETLKFIISLLRGTQGKGPFPETKLALGMSDV